MTGSKKIKCSVCGQPIKTAFGSMLSTHASLVCRRCFGEQSYRGSSRTNYSAVSSGSVAHEG